MRFDPFARLLWPLYDAGVAVATWGVLAPATALRAIAGRVQRGELGERLGASAPLAGPGPSLLVHAVSVGEVSAAGALIAALAAERPGWAFVLTTGTGEGRRAAEALRARLPALVAVASLPWDRRGALRRWLARLDPVAVVVVETEIWPNLFRACGELGVPLAIASGRLYSGDVARYRLARRFFAAVLAIPAWIAVQDEREREAFVAIGAPPERVEVAGNLKLDAVAPGAPLPGVWRRRLAASPRARVLVGASTHAPEEKLLLQVFAALRGGHPELLLVLAPRHPGRAARVRRLALAAGLSTAVWSQPDTAPADFQVLVVDEIGPLRALLALAEVAFVGGSLAGHGGHNPLEAAALRKAIVMGPSCDNVREIVTGLRRCGGILQLPAAAEAAGALRAAFERLLEDAEERLALGERAAAFCDLSRGVAARTARALLARIEGRAERRPQASRGWAGRGG